MCQLPYPTAILLDWDGTIANSLPLILEKQAQAALELGWPPLTAAQGNALSGLGYDGPQQVLSVTDAQSAAFWDAYARLYHSPDRPVILMDCAEPLLELLVSRFPVGIVSSKRGDALRQDLQKVGVIDRVKAIVGLNEAGKNKPEPDPALKALEIMQIAPTKHVWFVGDNDSDLACAAASNLTSILIGNHQVNGMPERRFVDCRSFYAYCLDIP